MWMSARRAGAVASLAAALALTSGCAEAQGPAAPARPAAAAPATPAACPAPQSLGFTVQRRIERSALGFTQGLERHRGALYESTGPLVGATAVNRISDDGRVTALTTLGATPFGEGLTVLDGRLWQLTWRDGQVFVYDLRGRRQRTFANPREGWGLANDGRQLIASDGSDRLFFIDPATFRDRRSVAVRLRDQPVALLNELEWVDGRVWANVFGTDAIVRIDPTSGCVEAVADLRSLREGMPAEEQQRLLASNNEFVLNGIAHDAATGRFYVTGKAWRYIFVGSFTPALPPGADAR